MEESGFSLNYPRAWQTRQQSNTLALSSDISAIDEPAPGEHLVILIDSTRIEDITGGMTETVNLRTIFDVSSDGPQRNGYTVGPTTPITVDGRSGLKATLTAEGGAGMLTVIDADPRIVRVLGQAAPAAWEDQRPVFEEIVESMSFFAPPPPPTPTPTNKAAQPMVTTQGPPGFVLRLGSNEGPREKRFVSARGLETSPDGTVYLAESSRGIWVFGPDGTFLSTFGKNGELLDAYDVDRGPNGDLFVADYGNNAIFRYAEDGTLIQRWGEIGEEDGQFGLQSPQRIAVGDDSTIYALDSHIDSATQDTVNSIVTFNGNDGTFLDRIVLSSTTAPSDIAIDSAGYLYLAQATNGTIIKIDQEGTEVARYGEQITGDGITPGALDVDRQGNIYVATWSDGILKLSPNGELLARGGTIAEAGQLPKPGQFSLPNGIAAAPGGIVWVSDNNGEYSAITAMRVISGTTTYTQAVQQQAITASTTISPQGGLINQWATIAKASSHYGDEYAPDSAIGEPDVVGCADSPNAWAPATPDTLETLELTFDTPVFATQVNIHQNHQPGFVTKVEVIDERGQTTAVYTGTAELASTCPYVSEISFEPILYRVVGVKLTIDQRRDANWCEIDAVELVGMP